MVESAAAESALEPARHRMSCTFDLWSNSYTGMGFLAVLVSFIDDNWRFRVAPVAMEPFFSGRGSVFGAGVALTSSSSSSLAAAAAPPLSSSSSSSSAAAAAPPLSDEAVIRHERVSAIATFFRQSHLAAAQLEAEAVSQPDDVINALKVVDPERSRTSEGLSPAPQEGHAENARTKSREQGKER